jgi:mxaJ protein
VCSDPNNLPYSNQAGEGFENRIAELIAEELDARLSYTWWPQRRGFVRETLREKKCDLVMGVPGSFELVLATRPYYRSTYVFLTRRDRGLSLRSLDDPALRQLRIGVHTIGDDYNNSPPAHALTKRGFAGDRVVGYSVYGDYNDPHPTSRLIEAVAEEEVDAAIVWGPIAGYFAARQDAELEMTPVSPQIDLPFLPFVYDIALGVRRDDEEFHAELEQVLERRRADIQKILDEYHVPRVGARRAQNP